jgi:hypothetical protein
VKLNEVIVMRSRFSLVLFIAFAWPLLAQTGNTGAITGHITDPSGALVPDTKVRVVSQATNEAREVRSGSDGVFSVPLLPPGPYRVEVSKSGFTVTVIKDVNVSVTETSDVPIKLQLGSETTIVEVGTSAEVVQTDSSALGRVVGATSVEGLPLVARNYTQIIGLSPGVVGNVTNAGDLGRGNGGLGGTPGVGFSANGDYSYDNNFQMNGLQVNDVFQQGTTSGGVPIPNPDTIQEFKVQTGQYDAAFGRNAGANVNVVTRGGTNNFHGDLFEFFRNTDLNANSFFSNLNGQPRAVLNQNQFGGTIGGPIRKNKLLFFGSYQGTRQINGVSTSKTMFSVPLTNDRSAQGIANVLYGPGSTPADRRGTIQNAMGGVGPAIAPDGSNINPIALQILNLKLPNGNFLVPTPQTVSSSGPLSTRGSSTFNTPSRFDEDQYMANVDFLQTPNITLTGRFFLADSSQQVAFPGGNVPGFPQDTGNRFVTASLDHTWIISSALLNDAKIGFNRLVTNITQQTPFTYSSLGILSDQQNNALPILNVNGSFVLATSAIGQRAQNLYLAQDDFSWTHGRHTMRFGGGLTRIQRNYTQSAQPGQLVFLSFADLLLGLNGQQNGTNVFSNVYVSQDLTGLFDRAVRVWEAYGYVQDDYRVSERLTLNLGARYDWLPPMSENLGRFSDVYPWLLNPNPPTTGTLQGVVVASNFAGTVPSGVTQTGSNTVYNGTADQDFGPRVGFAYRILPKSSRLVLRGGYGIYYSTITGQVQTQNTTTQPFGLLRVLQATANSAATLENPFPSPKTTLASFPLFVPYTPTTSLTTNAVDPNLAPGRIQQYSANVQAKLQNDLLLEVGYVGTSGKHLQQFTSINQALFASASNPIRGITTDTLANIQQRVPYEGWTAAGLQDVRSAGNMLYNALQASLTKRFSHGLQFLASYTWSKTLVTDGANADANSQASSAIGNQYVPDLRYGPANFSRPQRFVFSYLYELPWLKSGVGWRSAILGSWSVSGVITVQSGNPLTLIGTNTNNVFGITNDLAPIPSACNASMLATSGAVSSKLNTFFNTSCVNTANASAALSSSNPAAWPIIGNDGKGTGFGNAPIGAVYGPGQSDWDIALLKRTRTQWPNDAANVEFRTEFFNAFNSAIFSNPDTNVSNTTFGRISATSVAPRIIQFGLKLIF